MPAKISFRQRAIAGIVALAVSSCPSSADLDETRFCIVPVATDSGATVPPTHVAGNLFNIPGLPGPIYTPYGGPNWTIGADRRLKPYQEPFPNNFLDHWVVEPWSGRVVAAKWGGGIFVLNAGNDKFTEIDSSIARIRHSLSGPFALPSRRQTVVVAKGKAFTVEQDRMLPWVSDESLSRAGIEGIHSVHDAPSLGGQIVLTQDRDIFVLTNEQWHRVGTLDDDEDYGRVIDLPTISTVVFLANRSVVAIHRPSSDEAAFVTERLASRRKYGASFSFHASELFGELLYYGPGGFFDRTYRWQRLTADGLEDIPGGAIEPWRADRERFGTIQESPVRGFALIRTGDGLQLYDGRSIRPVKTAAGTDPGRVFSVNDLPSIGRTLVVSEQGLFDLGADGVLTGLKVDFPDSESSYPGFIDWAEAGVALVAVGEPRLSKRLYALDADLNVAPVIGGEAVSRIDVTATTVAATGDKLLPGKDRFYLAVDTHVTGREACRTAN